MDGGFIFKSRPVEKTHAIEFFSAIGVDVGAEAFQQSGEVGLLLFEVIEVAMMLIPFFMDEDPPHRVGANAVHPCGHRRDIARHVEAGGHHGIVAKDAVDHANLGMHVAEPDESVALDAIPEKFLHVEVHGVGTRLPDFVEALIGALEGADVGNVAQCKNRADLAELDVDFRIHVVDAGKAKAAGADRGFAEPREFDHLIAQGVVVLRAALAEIRHGFGHGLAKANAHRGHFLAFGDWSEQLDRTSDFQAEINHQRASRIDHHRRHGFDQHGLAAVGLEQIFRVSDALLRFPDHALRLDDKRGKRTFLCVL